MTQMKRNIKLTCILICAFLELVLISCKNESSYVDAFKQDIQKENLIDDDVFPPLEKDNKKSAITTNIDSSELSKKYSTLVDIQQLEPSLQIDIRYATTNNFMGKVLYESTHQIYLQKDVALKLQKAQQLLKKEHPLWSLLVFDGARPLSVQQKMWDALDSIPPKQRGYFLSNPASGGSIHNFGAAVDLSIVDANGNELDMGTPYDDIRELAYPRLEKKFLESGELTQSQIDNRKLLRKVMSNAGFYNIPTEWWHFNSCTRQQAIEKYEIIK